MNTAAVSTLQYLDFHKLSIDWTQVVRLEGKGNYTQFVFADGKTHLYTKSLCVYEPHLPPHFVRVRKGCIVNFHFVKKLDTENKRVFLTDNQEIRIARRRWMEVVSWFYSFLN